MSLITNMVSVITSTVGTGPITLGAVVNANFITEVQSGAVDGRSYAAHIQEGADFQLVKGTYTASGRVFTIDKVLFSLISSVAGTTQMTLGGSATVTFVMLSEDMQEFRDVRDTTGTSETIVNADGGGLVSFSNAGAIAVAIANITGLNFKEGWFVHLKNKGAGNVTITPTTATIEGAATFVLKSGQNCTVYSDGTNYRVLDGASLLAANNLSDLASASTARTNLGLGTSAIVNTGTSGATIPLLNGNNAFSGANTFDKTQTANEGTLTSASAADFSTKQRWKATVNGGTFTIANPTSPVDKTLYDIAIDFTTSHGVSFGANFKIGDYIATATAGKKDRLVFEYDSGATLFYLRGYRKDVGV